ncbi:MAG: hypothetical protein H0W27_03265 [Actinobacteria bacterium]|nr:hypothetical protein [Actinomycetota bacterium]MBA3729153.1 hypothetical protein [Actinomycetota bacterium]
MADYKEVRVERLHLKVPGTDQLRKNAAGRLRYLLAAGWRETDRWIEPDYLKVRIERSGHAPRMTRLPKFPALQGRPPRGGPGGRFGGPGGAGPGGPGGAPRGPRR